MEKEPQKELQESPRLPVDQLEDAINQIVGEPLCKQSACHGKGYTGIRINADGTRTLMLCKCGRWRETDYVKLMKRIEQCEFLLARTMLAAAEEIRRRTFFGGFEHSWLKLRAWAKKKRKK